MTSIVSASKVMSLEPRSQGRRDGQEGDAFRLAVERHSSSGEIAAPSPATASTTIAASHRFGGPLHAPGAGGMPRTMEWNAARLTLGAKQATDAETAADGASGTLSGEVARADMADRLASLLDRKAQPAVRNAGESADPAIANEDAADLRDRKAEPRIIDLDVTEENTDPGLEDRDVGRSRGDARESDQANRFDVIALPAQAPTDRRDISKDRTFGARSSAGEAATDGAEESHAGRRGGAGYDAAPSSARSEPSPALRDRAETIANQGRGQAGAIAPTETTAPASTAPTRAGTESTPARLVPTVPVERAEPKTSSADRQSAARDTAAATSSAASAVDGPRLLDRGEKAAPLVVDPARVVERAPSSGAATVEIVTTKPAEPHPGAAAAAIALGMPRQEPASRAANAGRPVPAQPNVSPHDASTRAGRATPDEVTRDLTPTSASGTTDGEPVEQIVGDVDEDAPAPARSQDAASQTSRTAPLPGAAAVTPPVTPAPSAPSVAVISAIRAEAAWAAHFTDARNGTGQEVTSLKIRLNPVELGNVTAHLTISDDVVSVELSAETAEAQSRLAADSDTIVKALRAIGLEVDRVSVQLAPRADTGLPSDQGAGARQNGFAADGGANGAREEGSGARGERGSSSGEAGRNSGEPQPQSARGSSGRYI